MEHQFCSDGPGSREVGGQRAGAVHIVTYTDWGKDGWRERGRDRVLQIYLHTAIDRILDVCSRQDCMQHYHFNMVSTKAKKQAQVCHIWRRDYHEHAVATRRLSKNLQQGRAGREVTGYRGDNTSQIKSRVTAQPRSRACLQATRWDPNKWGYADCINFRIQTVVRQGRGIPRGGKSRSKWAAQKHHRCVQSCRSEVGIWADWLLGG